MALRTAIENLNAARKKYDDELKLLGADAGKAVVEFLGEKMPPGFRIKWRQYTPYFNDGDACMFGVREPTLTLIVAGAEEDDEDDDDGDGDNSTGIGRWLVDSYDNAAAAYPVKPIDGLSRDALKALAAAWGELPEDMLEAAFGDHAEIVIRKDADGAVTFERTEASHD